MKGEDLIIIERSQENTQSDIYNGTWLEMAEDADNVKKYGSKVYRFKDGVEYLIIQTDITTPTQQTVINISTYHSYGWDIIEEDE